MAAKKGYKKGIACIESYWDADVETPLSVSPLLQIIASNNYTRYVHLTCNTKSEFTFALKAIPSRSPFRVLYFAFHGRPGKIELADGSSIPLPELSTLMGRKFRGWVLHFGTCGTLDTERRILQDFMQRTNVALLLGYKKSIDWIDSAAMDLILFNWIVNYKNMRAMWTMIRGHYRGLVARTGLTVFPRRHIS